MTLTLQQRQVLAAVRALPLRSAATIAATLGPEWSVKSAATTLSALCRLGHVRQSTAAAVDRTEHDASPPHYVWSAVQTARESLEEAITMALAETSDTADTLAAALERLRGDARERAA